MKWVAMRSILVLALTAAAAFAQVSPNGSEFQVNFYTTGAQRRPAVLVGEDGTFVAAWDSAGSAGSDRDNSSIQVRVVDGSIALRGLGFQANEYTTGEQRAPAVASAANGNFVVVWQSEGSSGTDTDGYSVGARMFKADGSPLGHEFQVNTYTTSHQARPRVSSDSDGNFVVVWDSNGSPGSDDSSTSIQARRYDRFGGPLGDQFQVNTYTSNTQRHPAVSAGARGGFIVAWQSYGSSGTDTSGWGIQARRYDGDGAPLGDQFQVNSYTVNFQGWPAVAVTPQGESIAVWASGFSNFFDLRAQRFDPEGVPVGPEFRVNSCIASDQNYPSVASGRRGEFVVAWNSRCSGGTDTSGYSVQLRTFDASGSPYDEDFQVNVYTTVHEKNPVLGADRNGNFVVVWQSNGSYGTDTSQYSIQARRFDALFRDGFEDGSTARWSAAFP